MNAADILEDRFPDLLPPEVRHLPALRELRHWHLSLAGVTLPGPWAEFGVYNGKNLRRYMLPAATGRQVYAFDSWEGLPEHWDRGPSMPPRPAGVFRTRVPEFSGYNNVVIVKGLFKDTLPQHMDGPPWSFLSLDADLYSSTAEVLQAMDKRIVPGTVLRFDEYQGYETAHLHEQKAFHEWGRQVEWFTRGRYGATCRVLS